MSTAADLRLADEHYLTSLDALDENLPRCSCGTVLYTVHPECDGCFEARRDADIAPPTEPSYDLVAASQESAGEWRSEAAYHARVRAGQNPYGKE